MAGERCEAFKPKEVDHDLEQTYFKRNANLGFISKMMLSMYDDSAATWKVYESHLAEVQERIKERHLVTSVLPLQDADATRGFTQFHRQRDFMKDKAEVRDAPAWPGRPRFFFFVRPGLPATRADAPGTVDRTCDTLL